METFDRPADPPTGHVVKLCPNRSGESLIEAGLVAKVPRFIRHHKLTQAAAAELLGIDEAKISAIFSGQVPGNSEERLMHLLIALAHDVEIVVKPVTAYRPNFESLMVCLLLIDRGTFHALRKMMT